MYSSSSHKQVLGRPCGALFPSASNSGRGFSRTGGSPVLGSHLFSQHRPMRESSGLECVRFPETGATESTASSDGNSICQLPCSDVSVASPSASTSSTRSLRQKYPVCLSTPQQGVTSPSNQPLSETTHLRQELDFALSRISDLEKHKAGAFANKKPKKRMTRSSHSIPPISFRSTIEFLGSHLRRSSSQRRTVHSVPLYETRPANPTQNLFLSPREQADPMPRPTQESFFSSSHPSKSVHPRHNNVIHSSCNWNRYFSSAKTISPQKNFEIPLVHGLDTDPKHIPTRGSDPAAEMCLQKVVGAGCSRIDGARGTGNKDLTSSSVDELRGRALLQNVDSARADSERSSVTRRGRPLIRDEQRCSTPGKLSTVSHRSATKPSPMTTVTPKTTTIHLDTQRISPPSQNKTLLAVTAFLRRVDPLRACHARAIASAMRYDPLALRKKLSSDYGWSEKAVEIQFLL